MLHDEGKWFGQENCSLYEDSPGNTLFKSEIGEVGVYDWRSPEPHAVYTSNFIVPNRSNSSAIKYKTVNICIIIGFLEVQKRR
jgi:hypothetical protein